MPRNLTTISTGSAMRRANDRFKKGTWADLKDYLDTLESRSAVAEAARTHGPLETTGQVDHHNEFVGNGPGAYFPQFEARLKNDIMRASIIQALRLALFHTFKSDGTGHQRREEPLPITCYWISGCETFEAYVDLSATEVHIFLVTPEPAPAFEPPHEDDVTDDPMWVCASVVRVRELKSRAPTSTYREPVAMPAGLTAVCQQVKSI